MFTDLMSLFRFYHTNNRVYYSIHVQIIRVGLLEPFMTRHFHEIHLYKNSWCNTNASINKSIVGFFYKLCQCKPGRNCLCRECKRKIYFFLPLICIGNSWEWLRCSVFVFCGCLLSMPVHIVSIIQFHIGLAVSRVMKYQTIRKYKDRYSIISIDILKKIVFI